ncbi:MAG: dUTP diphosphatase [Muribaculaceae bacterium]
MRIKFKKLTKSAIVPTKATAGSAAYDLYVDRDTMVQPGRNIISTGIAIELPRGYFADVRPRSGYSLHGFSSWLAARYDCDVLLGTIDSDYRGGINVIVRNNDIAFKVEAGQRIAQLVIHKCEDVKFKEVYELTPSNRGFKGFGSTGD